MYNINIMLSNIIENSDYLLFGPNFIVKSDFQVKYWNHFTPNIHRPSPNFQPITLFVFYLPLTATKPLIKHFSTSKPSQQKLQTSFDPQTHFHQSISIFPPQIPLTTIYNNHTTSPSFPTTRNSFNISKISLRPQQKTWSAKCRVTKRSLSHTRFGSF